MNSNNASSAREVAKLANVSVATVSRALRTPKVVKPETLEKIMKIVEEKNYKPKQAPPSASRIIAFFLSDVTNVFYTEVLRLLTDCARDAGYYVIACNTNSSIDTETHLFDFCERLGCAGIVLTGLIQLKSIDSDTLTVVLDTTNSIKGKYHNISSDNETAVKLLVDHLVKLGHKKIGFISGNAIQSAGAERKMLFRAHTNELGITVPEEYFYTGDFTQKSGFSAFDYFYTLPDMPTAIFSSNDEMAKGFIVRANALGVKIPEDISICGIDAIDNDFFVPQITSIKQDINTTVHEIVNIISGRYDLSEPKKIILPVTFSPGNTCYRI